MVGKTKCAACGAASGFELVEEPLGNSKKAYNVIRCKACNVAASFVEGWHLSSVLAAMCAKIGVDVNNLKF